MPTSSSTVSAVCSMSAKVSSLAISNGFSVRVRYGTRSTTCEARKAARPARPPERRPAELPSEVPAAVLVASAAAGSTLVASLMVFG